MQLLTSVPFNCKINKSASVPMYNFRYLHFGKNNRADGFADSTSYLLSHLKEIYPKEKINQGKDATVYSTNFDGYVLRLNHGTVFDSSKLKPVKTPNNYILAADKNDTMRIMKFVKGKPLYGLNWDIHRRISKEDYIKTFNEIKALPDKTFADYIKNIINIRKSGYNTDEINPNNILLDGEQLNIVDLTKEDVEPKIKIKDFDPLVNKYMLRRVLSNMSKGEIEKFADEIKNFYDRMIQIAKKEGYELCMPDLDHGKLQDITTYLYHKDMAILSL